MSQVDYQSLLGYTATTRPSVEVVKASEVFLRERLKQLTDIHQTITQNTLHEVEDEIAEILFLLDVRGVAQ